MSLSLQDAEPALQGADRRASDVHNLATAIRLQTKGVQGTTKENSSYLYTRVYSAAHPLYPRAAL